MPVLNKSSRLITYVSWASLKCWQCHHPHSLNKNQLSSFPYYIFSKEEKIVKVIFFHIPIYLPEYLLLWDEILYYKRHTPIFQFSIPLPHSQRVDLERWSHSLELINHISTLSMPFSHLAAWPLQRDGLNLQKVI